MSVMLHVATASCRSWTSVYTLGLPRAVRERRSAEIESDLWEQQTAAGAERESPVDTGFEILARVLLGIPADVTWRVAAGRANAPSNAKDQGARTMFTKLLASLATVFTVFAGAWFIFVAIGRSADSAEGFAVPLLGAGLALLAGGVAAFWSVRIGTALVAAGALTIVFLFPWMAGMTLPLALVVILGTLARGRGSQRAETL